MTRVGLLLDTHAFLWWLMDARQLSLAARSAIADDTNDVLVSAVSAWEIATKYRIGKLPRAAAVADDVVGHIEDQSFEELPISVADGARAGALPDRHRDPFDRILIAQALARNIVLVSNEAIFDRYAVRRLW